MGVFGFWSGFGTDSPKSAQNLAKKTIAPIEVLATASDLKEYPQLGCRRTRVSPRQPSSLFIIIINIENKGKKSDDSNVIKSRKK